MQILNIHSHIRIPSISLYPHARHRSPFSCLLLTLLISALNLLFPTLFNLLLRLFGNIWGRNAFNTSVRSQEYIDNALLFVYKKNPQGTFTIHLLVLLEGPIGPLSLTFPLSSRLNFKTASSCVEFKNIRYQDILGFGSVAVHLKPLKVHNRRLKEEVCAFGGYQSGLPLCPGLTE